MTSEIRSAIVTGASGGIGRAIVEVLREEGFAVTMVGRDADKLRAVAEAGSGIVGPQPRWLSGSIA